MKHILYIYCYGKLNIEIIDKFIYSEKFKLKTTLNADLTYKMYQNSQITFNNCKTIIN